MTWFMDCLALLGAASFAAAIALYVVLVGASLFTMADDREERLGRLDLQFARIAKWPVGVGIAACALFNILYLIYLL